MSSYRANRASPKLFTASYKPPRPRTRWSWRPVILAGGVIIMIWLLGRLPVFRIASVELKGSDDPSLRESLGSLVGESVFSRRINETENRLLQSNDHLKTLNCQVGLPSSLRCLVTLRQPVIIWQRQGSRFLLDNQGNAFGLAENIDDMLMVIEDPAPLSLAVGAAVASSELVSQYLKLDELLKQHRFQPTRYIVGESLYQLGSTLNFNEKTITVLFSLTWPLDFQLRTLLAFREGEASLVSERIDLRVPGYVYFK